MSTREEMTEQKEKRTHAKKCRLNGEWRRQPATSTTLPRSMRLTEPGRFAVGAATPRQAPDGEGSRPGAELTELRDPFAAGRNFA